MRPIERFLVLGGICAAILISLSGRMGDGRAYAAGQAGAPAALKIATVDVFVIAEAMMEAPDLKKARTDSLEAWQAKSDAIAKDLKELDTDLSILPQNDPKVQEILKNVEIKRQDYQKLLQDRQADLERINSKQLVDAYLKVRKAAETVAQRMEISHVISNREYSREITTHTLSQTLQELLARPLVNASQTEDITKAVMDEMKIGK